MTMYSSVSAIHQHNSTVALKSKIQELNVIATIDKNIDLGGLRRLT